MPDWVAIKADWVRSGASDVQLAKAWGFKSPTSIERRRKREGWKRDLAAASDRVVSEVVTPVEDDGGGVGGTHTAPSAAPTPPLNEISHLDGGRRLGVGGQGPDLASEASKIAPVHSAVGVGGDFRRTAYMARVEATDRLVRLGDGLLRVAEIYIEMLIDANSPDPGVRREALNRLGGLNTDKETIKGLLLATSQTSISGSKILREALGMDLKVDEPTSAASGGSSLGQILDAIDDADVVEKLREAAVRVRLQQLSEPRPPTIEHRPEPERSS